MERSSQRTPEAYKQLENASACVILFMTVWAPWAFGSNSDLTRGVLCGAGYLAGALLIAKWVVRRTSGYSPSRWIEPTPLGTVLVRALAAINVVFLLYVLVGALNARAVGEYILVGKDQGVNLNYLERTPIAWLPSSYDAPVSWYALVRWTGLAWAFWAARDWFLGKTRAERRETDSEAVDFPGGRLRLWLWVWVGSSFLLAVVCIIQRLDGTEKLLWLVTPQIRDPNSPWGYPPKFHFGPYNYRGNAAEYFNLVWPVAVALWWTTRANERRARGISARAGQGPHVLLLPWSVVLGTAPIASASRSGAVVCVGLALVTALILSSSRSIRTLRGRFLTLGSVIVLLAVGTWMLGGDVIHRFQSPQTDPYFSRLEVFDAAQRMAKDFLWLGGGADTFASLSPFYRKDVEAAWVGYAHNDFIEFIITLGVVGTGLLMVMTLIAFLLPWTQHRGGVSKEFTLLVVLALAGMMGHSLVDFPFQISSLQLEYLFLLAALTTLGRKGSTGASSGISG